MENVLEVSGLTKDYGSFALKNVSFKLPKGCIMGFIGENGAGKTTTLKLILNMIKKDSGDVRLLGMDHVAQEQQIKQQLGVVLDNCHFHESLKPGDISSVMRHIYTGWDDVLYRSYLKRFAVPEKNTVKQMSKGMKTKLSLSVALAHRPRVLLLDEATSGLDPVVRSEILDIFLDIIQDEERSIFLSTHIISDLEKVADYVTLIKDGQLVFSQSADDLKYGYGILKCGQNDFARIDRSDIEGQRRGQFGHEVLVKNPDIVRTKYPGFMVDPAHIEDIMLFYVRSDAS